MSADTGLHGGDPMKPTVTTYVRSLSPGAFFPEDEAQVVSERDPATFARQAPASVFAFSFYDVASLDVDIDGQPVTLRSRAFGESGLYYIDAESLTAGDVEAMPGDHSILLSNMRGNGWATVLRCRTGNFQLLKDGDVVISTTGAGEPS